MVFDFDDTLVESEQIKDDIFRKIFARYPKFGESAREFHRRNGSLPREEKFAWLATREFPCDEHQQRSCVEDCLREFRKEARELVARAREVPGIGKMLAGLFGQVPLYIASVNPQLELDFLIHERGWQKWFSAWYGNPPLSKELALGEIARREGVETRQLLLIGDSAGDKEAAEKAGSQIWLRKKGGLPGVWKDGKDLAKKLSSALDGG